MTHASFNSCTQICSFTTLIHEVQYVGAFFTDLQVKTRKTLLEFLFLSHKLALALCCSAGVFALLWAWVCWAGMPVSCRGLLPLFPNPEGPDRHAPPAAHRQQNLCYRQVMSAAAAALYVPVEMGIKFLLKQVQIDQFSRNCAPPAVLPNDFFHFPVWCPVTLCYLTCVTVRC